MVFILAAIVALLVLLVLVRLLTRPPRLPAILKTRALQEWERMLLVQQPNLRVLEAEKILETILAAHGFPGSFADKLRAAGPRLPNLQAVWEAHKLRNRIAHEMGLTVSDQEAKVAVSAFAQALAALL